MQEYISLTNEPDFAKRQAIIHLSKPKSREISFLFCIQAKRTDLALEFIPYLMPETAYNFGLQSACQNGHLELAKPLVSKSHIISVSRSIIKGAYGAHLECLHLLLERLEKENAFIDFDLALALKETALSTASQKALYAKAISSFASQDVLNWALRETVGHLHLSGVHLLLSLGANPLEASEMEMQTQRLLMPLLDDSEYLNPSSQRLLLTLKEMSNRLGALHSEKLASFEAIEMLFDSWSPKMNDSNSHASLTTNLATSKRL